jgi:hypothetical protein
MNVLDELDRLATVEHALVVEYLRVYAVLGQDVEGGDPRVFAAADAAMWHSVAAMKQLRRINEALVAGGRPVQVGRAGPLSAVEWSRLVDREVEIAAAVDASYERLRPHAGEELWFLVDSGVEHVSSLAEFRSALAGVPPAVYLRATRVEPGNDLERGLLALSDRYYALIVAAVGAGFAYDAEVGGVLLMRAVSVMDGLREVNRALVERGVVPAFTVPAPGA